jgi:hypothetical protein
LAEVTPVSTPNFNTTPSYTFSSTNAGAITYDGDCSSSTSTAILGNNTITFNTLALGVHNNCTITVGNSNILLVNSFTITGYSSTPSTSPNLTCSVVAGTCSGTTIFNLYDYLGNHAELPTQTNYPYKVCCTGTGISNTCSGSFDTVLKLSGATNAHAEKKTQSNYTGNDVCLSSSSMGVTCGYSNTACSSLGTNYVCLASISGDTDAHVGECSTYTTKVCCKVAVLVDACTSRVVANKFVSAKDTDIQLCSGADTTNVSDPCYNVCWKGTGSPLVTSPDWKCGICHNSSNVPVPCSTLGSTTFDWVMPAGYATPANYTLVGATTLTSANPIVRFTAQDSSRQITLNINTYGVSCSSQSSTQSTPTWKEISPF